MFCRNNKEEICFPLQRMNAKCGTEAYADKFGKILSAFTVFNMRGCRTLFELNYRLAIGKLNNALHLNLVDQLKCSVLFNFPRLVNRTILFTIKLYVQ